MDEINIPDAIEPTEWFVVFHPTAMNRILGWLALGKYKHVSAFAYCPSYKAWLLYDAQWGGTRLIMFSHATAKTALVNYLRGCIVVKMQRGLQPMGWTGRIAFYCVPAIRHLLSVRCACLRPDALLHYLLKNGGLRVDEGIQPTDPDRPQLAGGTDGSSG
jgi:hypothetical protein